MYTLTDMSNASAYAQERINLMYINKLNKKYPHLISHISYKVTKANKDTDYWYPDSLTHRSLKVDIKITKDLCEKISCNSSGFSGPCTKDSVASYYPIGDEGDYDVQCNPSCFNLNDGEDPQFVRTRWNDNNECLIEPSFLSWFEMPYYRSAIQFEQRVNDLPAGFTKIKATDGFASGYKYVYNKTYCDNYLDEYDSSEHNCYTPWYNKIVYAVVGESLVKYVRAGIASISQTSNAQKKLNINLPELDPKLLVENWKSDINKQFIDPNPDMSLGFSRKRRHQITKRDEEQAKPPNFAQTILDILNGLSDSVQESTFWTDMGIAIGADFVISETLKKLADTLIPKMVGVLSNLSQTVAQNVLNKSVQHVMLRVISTSILKTASRALLALSRILVQASTVIGIILAIISVFDIVLSVWDPLNFNTKYPQELLDKLMREGEAVMRKQYGLAKPMVNFNILCGTLLSDEELLEVQINSLKFVIEYLDSLTTNSEGSVIDKGDLVNTEIESSEINKTILVTKIPTLKDFENFEKTHIERYKKLNLLSYTSICAFILAIILLIFNHYNMIAIILLVKSYSLMLLKWYYTVA